jgi:WD40 repeat protein
MVLLVTACSPFTVMPEVDINTEEALLASIDPDRWIMESFRISPDNRTFVYGNNVEGKQVVVVNGKEQNRYDEVFVHYLIFSADSKHIAYAARNGEDYYMVVDGEEKGPYEEVYYSNIVEFSPDSDCLAYAIKREEKLYVIVDEKEYGPYDDVSFGISSNFFNDSIFSSDGSIFAFGARSGDKYFAVINGNEGTEYDALHAMVISKTGKKIAYIASTENTTFMVIDGKEGEVYDELSRAVFSPDESRVAYIASRGNDHFVVLDGQEGKNYRDIGQILAFSPDSKNIVYSTIADNSIYMVVNEQETGPFFQIDKPVFSPDGSHIAYTAQDLNGWMVVVDDEKGEYYHDITIDSVVFSPDSSRIAYVAQTVSGEELKESGEQLTEAETSYDRFVVVTDGEAGKEYRGIGMNSLTFSPDSTKVVYAGFTPDREAFIVLNDKEIGPYDDIGNITPLFNPDGSMLIYTVQLENEMFVVVNGTAGKPYDGILNMNGGNIIMDSANSFHYIGVANNKVYVVDETVSFKEQ